MLLAVWKVGPVAASPIVTSHDARRQALDLRIAALEREIVAVRQQRAALDVSPTGAAPVPHLNGG